MFYKFDQHQLAFVRDKKGFKICLGVLTGVALVTFFIGRYVQFKALDKYEKELVILNLEKERNKFTDEKFIELVKELNMKFPHIVYAQAILESGNFKSKIFVESNNMFGMREAKVRINTAKGTQYNHAYYNTWAESVYDYGFYQCRYMSNINTEEQYYQALDASYAEVGGGYSKALKEIVRKRNLKEIF